MKHECEKIECCVGDEMGFAELESLRRAYGVSQVSLCQRMGIVSSTYSRWKHRILVDKEDWQPRRYSLVVLRDELRKLIMEKLNSIDRAASAAE